MSNIVFICLNDRCRHFYHFATSKLNYNPLNCFIKTWNIHNLVTNSCNSGSQNVNLRSIETIVFNLCFIKIDSQYGIFVVYAYYSFTFQSLVNSCISGLLE